MCRAYADRGVVDGWGLMHSLLADVVDDIVGAASSEANSAAVAERDAWTLIASLSTELARDNCMGEYFAQKSLNCQGAQPMEQASLLYILVRFLHLEQCCQVYCSACEFAIYYRRKLLAMRVCQAEQSEIAHV